MPEFQNNRLPIPRPFGETTMKPAWSALLLSPQKPAWSRASAQAPCRLRTTGVGFLGSYFGGTWSR